MKPLQTSSGDLLADRRADYAEMLFASGEASAAAELLLGALELAPQWSFGWFRLGEFHEAAGAAAAAVNAWRMALTLDPADRTGAALKLQLANALAPDASPHAGGFVETLFDQYADTFDESLVAKLGYRVPDLLLEAILQELGPKFEAAIDLGCGTGLMGEKLRTHAGVLDGYDISAEMLRRAEGKGIYDHLHKEDLQNMQFSGRQADLVVAADVFMYVGALERVTNLAGAMLKTGGGFAFSVEKHDGQERYVLRPSRRYAHSEQYVRETLERGGFRIASLHSDVIRQDRAEPIEGLIVTGVKVAAEQSPRAHRI